MKTNYTYEKYLALYEICEGKTIHNLSMAGFGPWHKDKLSKEDFDQLNRRFQELENQDEDEWIAKNQADYMNVAEAEAEEYTWLYSNLFMTEVERFEAIAKAWKYVEILP